MKHNLLAIDASTEALSIALHVDGKYLRHFEVCPQQHSQKILPLVERLLRECEISLNDLDGIVFGRGPGSFTGVRISTAVAQGLAYSANLKLVGISTLQAMAQQAAVEQGKNKVLAAIDARMGEVYFAQCEMVDGIMTFITDECVVKPEALEGNFSEFAAVGTGFETYSALAENLQCELLPSITLPDTFHMLEIADREFEKGNVVEAADAEPKYVRDTVTWKKLPGR